MEPLNLLPVLVLLLLSTLTLSAQSRPSRDNIIITQQDYQGLQAFKHSISDPRGFLRSWNGSGLGACSGSWAGIKCVRGQVIAISLPWRGLGGQITEKVGQLTALRKISLHDNSITGQIPQSLGFLRDLRGVYLFNNQLSGSVPPSIGNCVLLQALDLSNNLLTGSVPGTVSNSTRLYRLNLGHNNFSGSIPDNWGRTLLRNFNLEHNLISGEIPISLVRQPMIEELVLGNNRINGSIPKEIGGLLRLRVLDLSENNMTGEIPVSLGHLANHSLSSFNVSYNNLSGSVPLLLSRKFDSSSFEGNAQLCGYSDSVPCISPNLPTQSVPPPPPQPKKHRTISRRTIVFIAAGIAIGLALLVCCVLCCCLLRKKTASREESSQEKPEATEAETEGKASGSAAAAGNGGGKLVHFDGPSVFAADDLLCATAEILGKSTYGTVYKATLEDGSSVSVKRLREKFAKGTKEFEAEVNTIGKARHLNLLALRAYYLGPKGEKLLVSDFMPKGSLASFLHARSPDSLIDWPTRLKIATGISHGLSYLHNQMSMIHCNLTSNNILLDEEANPKIADFGLSRLMTPAANSNAVAAAAALGYRAPELHNMKKASTKTDVYSFGVILLELLTGKSPSGGMNNGMELPQWVASVVKEEWTNEVFDPELMRDAEAGDEMVDALKLALQCVDPSPAARPEVQEMVQHLEELGPEIAGARVSDEGTSGAAAAGTSAAHD